MYARVLRMRGDLGNILIKQLLAMIIRMFFQYENFNKMIMIPVTKDLYQLVKVI